MSFMLLLEKSLNLSRDAGLSHIEIVYGDMWLANPVTCWLTYGLCMSFGRGVPAVSAL